MSLVLSNAFKGILLNSYINVEYELAVKSLDDLINKRQIGIYRDLIYDSTRTNLSKISQLSNRILRNAGHSNMFYEDKLINQFRFGESVMLCSSQTYQLFRLFNPHLQLVYTEDRYYHSFKVLSVKKSCKHLKQILKL